MKHQSCEPGAARAVAPDLKVSTDDLNEAGEHFLEVQANKASRAGPGAADARVPFQFVVEYSYGITDRWQVGVKLPFGREAPGVRPLGAAAEVRWLGPRERDRGPYWGMNFGLERARERFDEPWSSGVELQPVLGWRVAGWHLATNPTFGFPSRGPDRRATFALQSKAARRFGGHELGLEHFLEAAPLRDAPARAERREYLFLAWDKVYGNELNLALGRGLTDAAERWIVKVVYSFPLWE